MNVQTPRMEPESVAALGVAGFHYCAAVRTAPQMVQVVGDEPDWQAVHFDQLAGRLMSLTAAGGSEAVPLPLQLAAGQPEALKSFLETYANGVVREMKSGQIENVWLSEIDQL